MVELQVEMTAAMRACQTALLDLIDGCVKELKLGNTRVGDQQTTGNETIDSNILSVEWL